MKKNPVKAALKAGKPQIGTWLSFGDVTATRLMARTGFQWLTVDLEHCPIDWNQAAVLFALIAEAGCVPLARVPTAEYDHIKRALDAGAWGIVCPMVDTVEEAKAIISAAKYPPAGNRSLGGALHALNFGASAGDYYKYANDEVLLVLQTESPLGVKNAEAIYSLKGIDAIFVGPVDLSARMRAETGSDPTPEELDAMLQRVLAAGKKTGTPVGLHVLSAEAAKKRVQEGWQFIAVGSELRMMVAEAQRLVTALELKDRPADLARY